MPGLPPRTRTSPTSATTPTRSPSPRSPGRTTTSCSRRSSPPADPCRPVAVGGPAATGRTRPREPPSDEDPEMLAYVAKRLALAVGTVLAAVLITFLLVHAGNGTPGAVKAGPGASAAEIAANNEALGWNRPLYVQFPDYLGHLFRFDLGTSLIDGRSIAADLGDRLPVTGAIALFAALLSAVVGVLLGVTAAVRGGRLGKLITTGAGVALSLPAFWVGVIVVYQLNIKFAL